MPRIYVVTQHPDIHPMLKAFLQEAEATLRGEGRLDGWTLKTVQATLSNAFDPQDLFSTVNADPGPVLILGALKAGAIAALEQRARHRFVVARRADITDAADCYDGLSQCLEAHESGDPQISMRLLVVVQILTKLKTQAKWGGEATNKAFLWMDDLPKGGFDLSVQHLAIDIAYELVNRGILKSKKSNGRTKIALNGDNRSVIDALLRLEVNDRSLQKFLAGGPGTISARLLDKFVIDGCVGSRS